MKVNPDSEHVFTIIEKIYNNDGYCPCMPMKNDATKCPCRYMRKMKACRCGLYVRCDDAESAD
jgi:ferredoxin-thioredoxin reductase catalytic subunit